MATFIPKLVGLSPGVRVLVAGGTGTIGSGTVLSLLRQGAKVVVCTRFPEKFIELQHSLPEDLRNNLSGVRADVSTEKGVIDVLKEVSSHDGGVQHVVASLGSWWQKGRLIDQSLFEFNNMMEERVTSHFLMIKAFIPYLNEQERSTYTIITGNAGYEYLVPNTSLLCIGSGARNALALAAQVEYVDAPVAVGEVHVRCTVHEGPDKDMPQTDQDNIGHDLAGSAVTATIAARLRGRVVIHNRKEAKEIMIEDTEIM